MERENRTSKWRTKARNGYINNQVSLCFKLGEGMEMEGIGGILIKGRGEEGR